jgi:NitT/TauT family transport system permease protein
MQSQIRDKQVIASAPASVLKARRERVVSQMASRKTLSPRSDLVIGMAGIGSLVGVWCLVTYSGLIPSNFLPSPTGIWDGFVDLYNRDWLFLAIWRSFWRVSRAMLLVIVIGVPIGLAMGAFTPIDAFLRKIVNGAKSVPPTGLIGLIVLWFGIGEEGKVVYLFIGAILFMIILVKNAIQGVNEEYVKVAVDIGASPSQIVTRVLLPGALPQIWEAVKVCNGIMWTYIVLVEFVSANEDQLGLGYLLSFGSKSHNTPMVFASLLIIALISSFTDFVLNQIRKKWFNW